MSNKNKNEMKRNVLRIEKSPVSLDTTELRRLPCLIEVFEVEVLSLVRVGLADEGVHESLQIGDGRWGDTVVRVSGIVRSLERLEINHIRNLLQFAPLRNNENHLKRTVGQPVSAMDMTGCFVVAFDCAMLVSVKNSHVQPAASVIETFANQGCTLAI